MTHRLQPGDRVTSSMLVGAWEVIEILSGMGEAHVKVQRSGENETSFATAHIPYSQVVGPVLPPEPTEGEVVWTGARYWQRGVGDWWYSSGVDARQRWIDIAADAEPVVPLSKVADFADNNGVVYGDQIRAEFGWSK